MTAITSVRWIVLAALAVGAGFSSGVCAEGVADQVTVSDPYIRAVPPVVKTSAAFMQLSSAAAEEHYLIDASTPIAGDVELHMHLMDDGVMRMRRIPHIHLPSGVAVKLQPGGLHIMLFDLKAPLKPGEEIPLNLTFDDGSSKSVTARVRSVQSMMEH